MRDIFSWKAWFFYALFAFWPTLHAMAIRRLCEKASSSSFPGAAFFAAGLSSAFLYSGLEYFRCEVWFLNCPWLALGYGQSGDLSIYQSLGIWGVFGLTFLIIFFNFSLLAFILARRIAGIIFCSLLLVWISHYGTKKLETEVYGQQIKALLVQDESYSFDRLLSLSKNRTDENLIIWPENSFYIKEGESSEPYTARFSATFKDKNFRALLPVGIKTEKDGKIKRENFAIFLDPKTMEKQIYRKMHPVPFVEKGLKKGPPPEPVKYGENNIGVQICYDLNFENGSRILANKGARILLAPTNDPIEWTSKQQRQHADMSSARAVENNLWILRPATSGISQVIDNRGRIRAEMYSGESGTLSAQAQLLGGGTFYSRTGWLLPLICLILSPFILLWAFLPLQKRNLH
ncbi:MAG: hypothetical protein Fur0012_02830 [Elusimicrobiota bacterium]